MAVTQGRNFEAAQRCKRSADSLAPPLGGGVQVPGVAVSSHLSLSLLISGVTFHQRQDLGFWTLPAENGMGWGGHHPLRAGTPDCKSCVRDPLSSLRENQ